MSFHADHRRDQDPPSKPVQTVRCRCGHVYVITAGALARARPWVDRNWRDS